MPSERTLTVPCPAVRDGIHRVYADSDGGDRCEMCNILSEYALPQRKIRSPWEDA